MQKGKPQVDYLELLESVRYNSYYTPPPEQIVLKIDGENIGSRGNFITLTAPPKSGKSLFISAILASKFGIDFTPNGIVGYFDTESSEYDFYRQVRRTNSFGMDYSNIIPDHIRPYQCRRFAPGEIRKLIETFVINFSPKVIVIDGYLDLLVNFNSETESREAINWLKYLTDTFNILVIGCIHLGKKEANTLGHFGSMLDRYSQSVLMVDYREKIFTLKHGFSRTTAGFNPISLFYNGGWQTCQTPPDKPQKK